MFTGGACVRVGLHPSKSWCEFPPWLNALESSEKRPTVRACLGRCAKAYMYQEEGVNVIEIHILSVHVHRNAPNSFTFFRVIQAYNM